MIVTASICGGYGALLKKSRQRAPREAHHKNLETWTTLQLTMSADLVWEGATVSRFLPQYYLMKIAHWLKKQRQLCHAEWLFVLPRPRLQASAAGPLVLLRLIKASF